MRMKMLLFCMILLSWATQNATSQARTEPPTWAWPSPSARAHNLAQAAQTSLRPALSPIPSTFFGMHIHSMGIPRPADKSLEPWPTVLFGSWRLWDAHVAWRDLEPRKGEWHFELLDKDVALAKQHNVEILMPLGTVPTWASARPEEKGGYNPGSAAEPKSLNEWRDYVGRVAARYKGSIRNYEIWNEPNQKAFYTGDTQQLVTLTCEASQLIKEASPDNLVISPSPTDGPKGIAWLQDFLAHGGGKCVDVIGFHFYTDTPENMLPLIRGAREVMARNGVGNMPLWNTETGWPIENHQNFSNPAGLKQEVASAYIARAYMLEWAAGVSRFFYYAWDNKSSGLTEPDGETLKKPALAYRGIYDWMVGAVMNSCVQDKDGTWVVELRRRDRGSMWVVWNPQGKSRWTLPVGARAQSALDISGRTTPISPDRSVMVDFTPQLIEIGH